VDDLLQEILLSIHKSRHTYNNDRPFRPWVFTIAKFRLLDHLRKHYADHLQHAEDLSAAESIPDDVTPTRFSFKSVSAEVS
jgi:RNA polymerase sigma-70 factor, ECF subfamily